MVVTDIYYLIWTVIIHGAHDIWIERGCFILFVLKLQKKIKKK